MHKEKIENHHHQPTAYHSPLLYISLSNCPALSSNLGFSRPATASHLAQIVTKPGLWTSYTTFTEARSPLNRFL